MSTETQTDDAKGESPYIAPRPYMSPTTAAGGLLSLSVLVYAIQKFANEFGYVFEAAPGVFELMFLALVGIGFAVLTIAAELKDERVNS